MFSNLLNTIGIRLPEYSLKWQLQLNKTTEQNLILPNIILRPVVQKPISLTLGLT